MKELLELGGPIVWIQLLLLFFALVLIIERLLFFQGTRINEKDLLIGIGNHVRRRAFAEAIHESSLASGPIGRIFYSVLNRHQLSRTDLRGVAEDAVAMEIPRIERSMRGLMGVTLLCPLTGLLGTVLGMMDVFFNISEAGGYATQALMSQGIFESLATTAIGLAVATVTYAVYLYLYGRSQRMLSRLDAASVSLVNIIFDAKVENEVISFEEQKSSFKKQNTN